jgi:hypothetical protein
MLKMRENENRSCQTLLFSDMIFTPSPEGAFVDIQRAAGFGKILPRSSNRHLAYEGDITT